MKVLMICLGNICRSPMAEGILREMAAEKGVNLKLDSCGTSGLHSGELPDSRAISNLQSKGIDITDLRSRQFRYSDFEEFDELFVMDESNFQNIAKLTENKEHLKKLKLFLNEAYPNENMEVPDPYYGGDSGFENVYNLLNEASEKFLERIS